MPGLHARFVLEASRPATEPFTPGSGIRIRHGTTTGLSPSHGDPYTPRNYDAQA